MPVPAITSGGLDRASARRAWPAVLAEIRRIKPTRAEMYGRIEADVDSDGQTLLLEFPADQEFAMQMAEEPDMRELLQRALGAAIGFAPPVRFRLGKSLATAPVAPAPDPAPQPDPAPVADEVPDYAETRGAAIGSAEASTSAAEPSPPIEPSVGSDATAALRRELEESLGVRIVAEHPPESDDPADAAAEGEASSAVLDVEPGDYDTARPRTVRYDRQRGRPVNFGNMMKQAQKMQTKMAEMQEQLKTETLEASAGGGMVRVVITGDMVIKELHIDPAAIDPEDVEMLQDMVAAAVNEAIRSMQELASRRMSEVTGGMNIPGLM